MVTDTESRCSYNSLVTGFNSPFPFRCRWFLASLVVLRHRKWVRAGTIQNLPDRQQPVNH